LSPVFSRAGEWLLRSGIQEANGGVARYYRADIARNRGVSTEITGYVISTLVYLHSATGKQEYLDRAVHAARFLTGQAWDREAAAMPFEVDPPEFTYFFDCGIIVRGLLAAWRASGEGEFLDAAAALGRSMARDFDAGDGSYHPILSLPGKHLIERDSLRWSRSAGCYQLKAAMAWWELWEAGGEARFRECYDRLLERSLRTWDAFLPGHPERPGVMDRLHPFAYFLEGLLPRGGEPRCAAALSTGIGKLAGYVREIGPAFERADVLAQLLRIRIYADWCGAAPLDRQTAQCEAARLAGYQADGADARISGGFYFGRRGSDWLPHISPVSTAFALQALMLWDDCVAGRAQAHRHLLI
jgi:hypothetical protein